MQFADTDFGTIIVTVNPRAHRIIMRAEIGGLRVTAPRYATKADVLAAIDKFRTPLLQQQEKAKQHPPHTDEEISLWRREAHLQLPRRVAELAHLHGFTYAGVKIQSSRTRWGSCSSRNSINLSLYMMQLPEHLQDYVILHELCHTVHHDHSAAFWALMDRVTDGRATAWNKEIKQYHAE